MERKFKSFKLFKEKCPCYSCETLCEELSSIVIRTYDVSRRYKTSKRPMINNMKVKVCPSCFARIMKDVEDIII